MIKYKRVNGLMYELIFKNKELIEAHRIMYVPILDMRFL